MKFRVVGPDDGAKSTAKKKDDENVMSYEDIKTEARRKYERILFDKLLGVYAVAEGSKLNSVELVDISTNGIRFQISSDFKEQYKQGEMSKLRLYFSHSTYITAVIKITNVKPNQVDGRSVIQYGGEFDKSTKSYKALQSFADFVHAYSEACSVDDSKNPIFIL